MPEPLLAAVSLAELRALLADPALRLWLIHATDAHPFTAGHIPGSLARPDVGLLRRLGHDVPIVVYGEDEHAVVAPTLVAELHHLDVEVAWFAGGLAAWTAAALPLERSG